MQLYKDEIRNKIKLLDIRFLSSCSHDLYLNFL